MEQKTSKYLLQVALKTLALLLAVTVLAVGIFLVASPKLVSEYCGKLGMDKLSASYAKVQYERSKNVNDLAKVFERSVTAESYSLAKKYGEIFVDDQNFDEFCKFKDSKISSGKYRAYVFGNLAIATYHENGMEDALKIDYGESGYSSKSSQSYLVFEVTTNGGTEKDAAILLAFLEQKYNELSNDESVDLTTLLLDGYAIEQKQGGSTVWQTRITNYKNK